jgi:hypothetical protein
MLKRLLIASLLLVPGAAFAQGDPVVPVRIIVLDVSGNSAWGAKSLTGALRSNVEKDVQQLLPDKSFLEQQRRLGIRPPLTPESIAKIGRAAGANYVLWTRVNKKGWQYTAWAQLVNTTNAEVQMDFRSDYFKPAEEAADRGWRIAKKTIEKLRILLKDGPPPAIAQVSPENVPEATPPKTETPPTATPPTPETPPATTPPADGAVASATPPPPQDDVFEDPFAGGSIDESSSSGGEFDGFSDEGGWQWSVQGWVGVSYQYFPHSDVRDDVHRSFPKIGSRTTINGKLGEVARLRVLPLIEVDVLESRLHRVVLEEGFVELQLTPIELRVGWDALTWGAASTLNIVDVINARNLREGFLDAPKVGQPMVAARLIFGNHSLALLFLAPFVPPAFPLCDSVFNSVQLGTCRPGETALAEDVFAGKGDEWHPQVAARLAFSFSGLDLRASYFNGYARQPLIKLTSSPPTPFYPLIHSVGTDGQLLVDKFAIKWEVMSLWHQRTDRVDNPPIVLPNGEPAGPIDLPDQRFSTIFGLEYTMEGVIGDTILVPVAEVVLDSDSALFTDKRPPDDFLRIFQNHLILALDWSFENASSSKVRLVDLIDLDEFRNNALEFRYSQRIFEHFTIEGGGRWVFAADGGKMAAFRALSGVFIEYRLNY